MGMFTLGTASPSTPAVMIVAASIIAIQICEYVKTLLKDNAHEWPTKLFTTLQICKYICVPRSE